MSKKRISDDIPFSDVAKVLEATSTETDGKKKKQKVKKLIDACRTHFMKVHKTLNSCDAEGDSLFPIIRILLPNDDRGREAYGFKSQNLGRMLAEALGLSGRDKDRLKNFRDPQKSGGTSGDISTLVEEIMKPRFSGSSSKGKEPITVSYLHEFLDRIAREPGVNQAAQKGEMFELFAKHNVTPLEGKWICRLLLKDLGIGIGRNVIFGLLHSSASKVFERDHNLESLCQKLNDPEFKVEESDINSITLFHYCKPMLALRTTTLDDFDANADPEGSPTKAQLEVQDREKQSGRKKKQVEKLAPPFVVETKWDGERFQLHYDGHTLKYFSRKGFDKFTSNFESTLTPRLRPQILPQVRSFILDGEMMAWNKRSKQFTDKGGPIDVKRFTAENTTHCPCFVVFDVLLFNGEVVIDKPLHERAELLKKIITSQEGTVLVTEQRILETKEQVEHELNTAIDNQEEGLIVKGINSVYIPAFRGPTWRKVKPEYIHGTSADDLDLLILGAYFAEGMTVGGSITHFLVGVIDKTGPSEKFYPVAQVGSGRLKHKEMRELVDKLQPHLKTTEFPNVIYKARKRPDRFINPKDSIIVQIKASEINPSYEYVINYSLRFPRIVKVRDEDKNYDDAMTLQEFHTLRESCGGKLAKRTDQNQKTFYRKRKVSSSGEETDQSDEDESKKPSPSKMLKMEEKEKPGPVPGPSTSISTRSHSLFTKAKVIQNQKTVTVSPVKKDKVVVQSNIFGGKTFCVYGVACWKTRIEQDIQSNGGDVVQNPINVQTWIVGESITNIKIEKAVNSCRYNVLKSSWIARCLDAKAEIELSPDDFFKYTEDTGNELFEGKYDRYGDSYTKSVTLDETKELVKRALAWTSASASKSTSSKAKSKPKRPKGKNKKVNSESDCDNSDTDVDVDKDEMNLELFPGDQILKVNQYKFFKEIRAAFIGVDNILAAKVEFYGGIVVEVENEDVTHIIVKDPSSLSPSKIRELKLTAFLVKPKWIVDCVKQRKILDEFTYGA